MPIYLIDFENTGSDAFKGVDALTAGDRVVIFYSNGSIPLELFARIIATGCRLEPIKTTKVGKNYLDFQLVTYLGWLIAQNDEKSFFVVTKDNGFDSVCDFWRERSVSVIRQETLSGVSEAVKIPADPKKTSASAKKPALIPKTAAEPKRTAEPQPLKDTVPQPAKTCEPPESVRKKIRALLGDEKLKSGSYTTLYSVFAGSKNQSELKASLIRHLGQKRGENIFALLLPVYADYHKTVPISGAIREKIAVLNLSEHECAIVENYMNTSENTQELHNSLMKTFKNENGTKLYKLLLPLFSAVPKKSEAALLIPDAAAKKIHEKLSSENLSEKQFEQIFGYMSSASDTHDLFTVIVAGFPENGAEIYKQIAPVFAGCPEPVIRRQPPKPVKTEEKTQKPVELPENVQEKIRTALKSEKLRSGAFEHIFTHFIKCGDEMKLFAALEKQFQQERGTAIYKLILPIFCEYRGLTVPPAEKPQETAAPSKRTVKDTVKAITRLFN